MGFEVGDKVKLSRDVATGAFGSTTRQGTKGEVVEKSGFLANKLKVRLSGFMEGGKVVEVPEDAIERDSWWS